MPTPLSQFEIGDQYSWAELADVPLHGGICKIAVYSAKGDAITSGKTFAVLCRRSSNSPPQSQEAVFFVCVPSAENSDSLTWECVYSSFSPLPPEESVQPIRLEDFQPQRVYKNSDLFRLDNQQGRDRCTSTVIRDVGVAGFEFTVFENAETGEFISFVRCDSSPSVSHLCIYASRLEAQ